MTKKQTLTTVLGASALALTLGLATPSRTVAATPAHPFTARAYAERDDRGDRDRDRDDHRAARDRREDNHRDRRDDDRDDRARRQAINDRGYSLAYRRAWERDHHRPFFDRDHGHWDHDTHVNNPPSDRRRGGDPR